MSADLFLQWKNLEYSIKVKEYSGDYMKFWQLRKTEKIVQVLKKSNGCFKTGNLTAILGESGAGKTTLLAAISQRLIGNVSGEFTLNGLQIDQKEMSKISSFMPQFDIVMSYMTAFEHLYFVSHFKIDKSVRNYEKTQKVYRILNTVGLRSLANTKIIHLSGGERKRLSLAEQLLTDTRFIFCDEPTSGLDSYNAFSVIKTLRKLSQPEWKFTSTNSCFNTYGNDDNFENNFLMEIVENGENDFTFGSSLFHSEQSDSKGIICSIHQPTSEVFELFTHVILMQNGRIVFHGSATDASIFFSKLGFKCPLNCNFADYLLKIVASEIEDESSSNGREVTIDCNYETLSRETLNQVYNFSKISWIYQVYLLVMRSTLETRRNFFDSVLSIGFCLLVAIILAVFYSNVNEINQITIMDINGAIFLISSELIFSLSYPQCLHFSSLLPILRRECGEGTYSLSAYYFANIISLVPKAFIYSYAYLGIIFIGSNFGKNFLTYILMALTLSVCGLTAIAYGIFLSSLFDTEIAAAEFADPIDTILLAFGGYYFSANSIPILKYISMFFFANDALMFNCWSDVKSIDCGTIDPNLCLKNGTEVLERYAYSSGSLTLLYDYIALILQAFVFHLIAYYKVCRHVKRIGYF